jgi:VanZ family protein
MSTRPAPRTLSRRTRAWLWAGLFAAFIVGLGGEDLSYDHTSRFLGPLIRWLLPNVSDATSEWIQFAIRKTAHLAEYGLLGFLTLRALLTDRTSTPSRTAVVALLLTTAFAAADETRQSLLATRMGSFLDVMLDSLGAGVGIALLRWGRTHLPGFDRRIGLTEPPASSTRSRSSNDTKGESVE